jgi:hypothetical protein
MSNQGSRARVSEPNCATSTNSCSTNSYDVTATLQACPNTSAFKSATFPPQHKYARSGPICPMTIGSSQANYIPDMPSLISPPMATDGILSPGSSVSEFSSLPSNCNHVRPKPFTDPGCPSMLPSFIPLPRHDCLRGRHKLPSLSSLPFATGLHLDGSSTTTEEFYAQRIAELPGVAQGPSCVLPFLYIGSKFDALDPDIINVLFFLNYCA